MVIPKAIRRNRAGQAIVEYLMVFSFMVGVSFAIVKLMSGSLGSMAGSLGFHLSSALSSGVCAERCFHSSYKNGI